MKNQNDPPFLGELSYSSEWHSLLRPHMWKIQPYSSARDECKDSADIWLDANELPFGDLLNRYPDPRAMEVKKAISKLKTWEISNFLLGNGSDECIELLIKLFCEPGIDEIMICPPTYGMYKVSAQINNVIVREVPLNSDFQLQVDEILRLTSVNTKMIFICSPNNPTGNLMDRLAILRLLNKFKGIIVIDEAYVDFAGVESWTSMIDEFPRLIVLQTLSKSAGLAGLRIGICYARADLIERLYFIKPPYNLSIAAQHITIKALKKIKKLRKFWAKINAAKRSLFNELTNMASVIKVYPSDANFLLIKVQNANHIYELLTKNGIVVRNRSHEPLCESCLRISIGKKSEIRQLIRVWKNLDKTFKIE